ncbi:MAG: tetratricopeptide repeat protein [Candidatus Omnitrophica bacterium]|nr:tetratricopeptide repeat protein [Candidatus Omnitrophota bacterium]
MLIDNDPKKIKQKIGYWEKLVNEKKIKEDLYFKIAYGYEDLNNFRKAIFYFRKIIRLGSADKCHVFFNIGYCYQEQDNFKKAIFYFKKALELQPRDKSIHGILSCAYLDASIAYKKKNPKFSEAYARKALLHSRKGRNAKEMKLLLRIYSLNKFMANKER